jgi:hypothetical protein
VRGVGLAAGRTCRLADDRQVRRPFARGIEIAFDFGRYTFGWALLVRVLLVIAAVGADIGVLVQLAVLASCTSWAEPREHRASDPATRLSPGRRRGLRTA